MKLPANYRRKYKAQLMNARGVIKSNRIDDFMHKISKEGVLLALFPTKLLCEENMRWRSALKGNLTGHHQSRRRPIKVRTVPGEHARG